jgi:hypothetical protein
MVYQYNHDAFAEAGNVTMAPSTEAGNTTIAPFAEVMLLTFPLRRKYVWHRLRRSNRLLIRCVYICVFLVQELVILPVRSLLTFFSAPFLINIIDIFGQLPGQKSKDLVRIGIYIAAPSVRSAHQRSSIIDVPNRCILTKNSRVCILANLGGACHGVLSLIGSLMLPRLP